MQLRQENLSKRFCPCYCKTIQSSKIVVTRGNKITINASPSLNAEIICSGQPVKNKLLESDVYDRILALHQDEISVSIASIISNALPFDNQFKLQE